MASLIGVMIGSLNKIWPWKNVISYRVNSKGIEVPFIEKSILPDFNAENNYIIMSIIFCAIGILTIYFLQKLDNRK